MLAMPWIKDNYQRFFPSLTWQVDRQIPRVLAEAPADACILDLGAGGRKVTPHALCVDFVPFPGTNVIANVEALPFRDASAQLVIATGLLEHVEDDRSLLREVARVLAPGGTTHFEVPFMQQYHDDPIDCRRTSVPGLEREMRRVGLEPVRAGVHIGPTVTLITHFTYYAAMWFEGPTVVHKALSSTVFLCLSVLLFPFKFLDRFLLNKKSAHRLAFGVYCTATKL
jgi:SAM-dependent methyltransferase